MRPALSDHEWRDVGHSSYATPRDAEDLFKIIDTQKKQHRIAALALHGQPFGFDRLDVEFLRAAADSPDLPNGEAYASIADRIDALLPPELKPRGEQ